LTALQSGRATTAHALDDGIELANPNDPIVQDAVEAFRECGAVEIV